MTEFSNSRRERGISILCPSADNTFNLDVSCLRTPLYKSPFGTVTISGSFGASKSTLLRALANNLNIPQSRFSISNQAAHTTRGVYLSGQNDDGIVLVDAEGQNFGDVENDLCVQKVQAILCNSVHLHVVSPNTSKS